MTTSAFKRESSNFIFELNNKNLTVSYKTDYEKLGKWEDDDYIEYGVSKGSPLILVIKNFLEKVKGQDAISVIQTTLSAFYHTFEKQGDQREQLRKGLRYFALADHYGVLAAAFPKEVLDGANQKYKEFLEKLDSANNDFSITEQMIKKFHINEPLVASTGLVVFASLNDNWFMYETSERHKELPEYLYTVIHHNDFKLVSNTTTVFNGTQNQCQQYIINKQKEIYGVSLNEYKALIRKIEVTTRTIEDMEILLDIPYQQTLSGKTDLADKEQAIADTVDANFRQLDYINLASKPVENLDG